jgi:hypothetical protein
MYLAEWPGKPVETRVSMTGGGTRNACDAERRVHNVRSMEYES